MPQLGLLECIRVLKKDGLFAGYIGTVDNEKRVFYNSSYPMNLAHKVHKVVSKSRLEYNHDFNKILSESKSGFKAEIGYLQQGSEFKPHKIYLIKSGIKQEVTNIIL